MVVHWKIWFLGGGGGVLEKSIYWGDCPNGVALWDMRWNS